ncbi:regulatory protein GemA [Candidatus Cyanaurora vandensis]|uniref:regulatory protein GemA n=1 Tax=Candidatus Cyanaurora vandensis TaxID=2714958 RepID=UPI0025801464|nr:regulatory protein GemA [Candidatus Cyanaurora vandensis]
MRKFKPDLTSLNKVARASLIRAIHAMKTKAKLPDDVYRGIIHDLSGGKCNSSTQLDDYQLKRLADHLREKSGQVRNYSPSSKHKPAGEKTHADKLRALWISGSKAAIIRDGSETALLNFVNGQLFGRDKTDRKLLSRLEWLNPKQGNQCVEALKKIIERGPVKTEEGQGE